MLTVAFLIAIIAAFLFGFRFLGTLLLFIAGIVLYVLNLSFWLNSSVSTVVVILTLAIGLMLFWMYVRVTEERKQKDKDESQSNLA